MAYGIWRLSDHRWVGVDVLCLGIIHQSVRCAYLTFGTLPVAEDAKLEIARILKVEPKALHVKKIKQGMTPEREKKLRIQCVMKLGRMYCGHCGRKITQKFLEETEGNPVDGKALLHGEFVAVKLCSFKCQRALESLNERTLKCLDQEMVALQNVERVRKSLKHWIRTKTQEVSQSPRPESEPAVSSPN